jgi:hypothetical protein
MQPGRSILILQILAKAKKLGEPIVPRTKVVKVAYLAEMLRPTYNMWWTIFEFVRFHYGPYSIEIRARLDFLIFHGLARLVGSQGEAAAFYEITKRGSDALAKAIGTGDWRVRASDEMIEDISWSLQTLNVKTVDDICKLVYREPAFLEVLQQEAGPPHSLRDAPNLPITGADHPSMTLQVLIMEVAKRRPNIMDITPREITRLYLMMLLLETERARATQELAA